jgi:hypothetical protein
MKSDAAAPTFWKYSKGVPIVAPVELSEQRHGWLATGGGLPNVVVTGLAMTTAVASDAETTWAALLKSQSGIRRLDDPFVEEFNLPVRIGGHLVEEFDSQLTRVELRRMGYLQKMAAVLGRRVWDNADGPEVDVTRLMVSIGTGMGSTEELVWGYDDIRARGIKAVHPLGVQMYMPNGAAAVVGLRFRLGGHRPGVAPDRVRRGRQRDLRGPKHAASPLRSLLALPFPPHSRGHAPAPMWPSPAAPVSLPVCARWDRHSSTPRRVHGSGTGYATTTLIGGARIGSDPRPASSQQVTPLAPHPENRVALGEGTDPYAQTVRPVVW